MHWVRELGKSVPSASRAALLLGVVAVACSGRSADTTAKSCAADGDCATGQRCAVPADRPAIGPAPGSNGISSGTAPCAGLVLCEDLGATCLVNQICAPSWQTLPDYPYCGDKLCAARCTETSCPPDAVCMDDGLCHLTSCAESGAEPCPELWRCDPASAATASHEPATGAMFTENGFELERHIERGCVRLNCAEEGGYACAAAWSCTPEATTNPSGCVPEECQDTGHCSDDTALVCRTQAKHLDHGSLDLNGCVPRTCDDGYSCSRVTEAGVDVGACRYGAPNADYYGCVLLPCTTDDECFYDYVCDHASGQSDERGCRQQSCTEGAPCPLGFVCDPSAVQHDGADCTTPEFASSGGASGTGTGGSGGSPAGGATTAGGSGGSAPESPLRGECVAR